MSDAKTPPGGNGHSGFQPRWRLDLDDDGTVTFDRTTQTISKIKTGESSYLGDYRWFAVEEPRYLRVSSSHAPPIGRGTSPGTSDYFRSPSASISHSSVGLRERNPLAGGEPGVILGGQPNRDDGSVEEHVGQIRQRHRPAIDEARDRVQVVHASHKLCGVANTFPCRIACCAVGGVILPGCVRSGTAAVSPAAKTSG